MLWHRCRVCQRVTSALPRGPPRGCLLVFLRALYTEASLPRGPAGPFPVTRAVDAVANRGMWARARGALLLSS